MQHIPTTISYDVGEYDNNQSQLSVKIFISKRENKYQRNC